MESIKGMLFSKNVDNTEVELIRAIDEARADIESARAFFNLVSEPKLVDYAIYLENAARARYTYLLDEAKIHGIKVNEDYLFEKYAV